MRVARYIGFDQPQQYDKPVEIPGWLDSATHIETWMLVIPMLPVVVAYYAQAHVRRRLARRVVVYLEVRGAQWTLLAPPAKSRDARRYESVILGGDGVYLSNAKSPMKIIADGQRFRLPETVRRYQVFEDADDPTASGGAYRSASRRPGDPVAFELPSKRPRGGQKACLTYSGTTLRLTCGDETHALEIPPQPPEVFFDAQDGQTLEAWLRRIDADVAMTESGRLVFAQLTFEGIPIEVRPLSMDSFNLEIRTPVNEARYLKMSPQGAVQDALIEYGYGISTGDLTFDRTWWIKGDPVSVKALSEHARLREAAPWRIRSGWASMPATPTDREQLLSEIAAVAELGRVLSTSD